MGKQANVTAATQAAARRAWESQLGMYAAAIRRHLKQRSHRKPTEQQVTRYLHEWLASGGLETVATAFLGLMQQYESAVEKPSREWTSAERQQAFDFAARFFRECAAQFDRPRGRPRRERNRNIRGIVNRAMVVPRTFQKDMERQHRDLMKSLEYPFLRFEKFSKLGAAARRERDQLVRDGHTPADADRRVGTLKAYLQYMTDAGIEEDEILRKRLAPGLLRRFLTTHGLSGRQESAFKMRMSRARRKHSS